MSNAGNLIRLWENEKGLVHAVALEAAKPVAPAVLSGSLASTAEAMAHPSGFCIPTSGSDGLIKVSTNLANFSRPPRTGDATWLLNEFLNEKYPLGGTIQTGNTAFWQEHANTNLFVQFAEFLDRPLYKNNPRLGVRKAEVGGENPTSRNLFKGIGLP